MFTDLHCHLLPGIDDGPAALEQAVSLARMLARHGFEAAVATPHAMPAYPGPEVVEQRAVELKERLAEEGVALTLMIGAENPLDAELLEREQAGKGRHLNGTAYTLIELPFNSVVPQLPDLLFRLRRLGVRPVIAHPERSPEFEDAKRAAEAVRLGALMQLDVGSLAGRYGRGPRKLARAFLEAGTYDVAASDVHAESDERWLAEALTELEKLAGRAGLERLLVENPGRIVRGEEWVS